MRNLLLASVVVVLGCHSAKESSATDMGANEPGDLAGVDLAGVDLAGVDLAGTEGQDDLSFSPSATTHVVYRLSADGHVYRVAAHAGETPEDVSNALNAGSPGDDVNIGISRDGNWLSLTTTRFGCGSWACLALVTTSPTGATSTSGSLVMVAGPNAGVVHPENRVAVARDAAFVVYSASGGTHTHDLWLAPASGDPSSGAFGTPTNITAGSTFDLNDLPALSPDEKTVVFDCQAASSGGSQNICVVNTDGTGFKSLVGPTSLSGHTTDDVHSGDYVPDGTVVFEASWEAEQIWHRDLQGNLSQIAPTMTNDNSPCALPDGRVASLWLERPGNPSGYHELKVSTLEGSYEMVLINQDINDIGIGCGE